MMRVSITILGLALTTTHIASSTNAHVHIGGSLPFLSTRIDDLLAFFPLDGNLSNQASSAFGSSPNSQTTLTAHSTSDNPSDDSPPTLLYTADAVENQALYFSGDTYLELNLDLNEFTSPQLTMGCWVKTTSQQQEYNGPNTGETPYGGFPAMSILTTDNGGNDRGLSLAHNSGVVANLGKGSGGVEKFTTPLEIKENEWQFVSVVYDAVTATATVNVDGKSVTSAAPGMGQGRAR
jgi:hypothetical protein